MAEGSVIASVMVHLDRSSAVPLHRQVYDALRGAILAGRLGAGRGCPRPGTSLRSSAALATRS